jgi:hypothetical protein
LAEEQVILIAEVKVKGGSPDRRTIQHFLHSDVIDWLFGDQLYQGAAEPLVGTPGALIGFSPALFLFGWHVPALSTSHSWTLTASLFNNSKLDLDLGRSEGYIANHMTNRSYKGEGR